MSIVDSSLIHNITCMYMLTGLTDGTQPSGPDPREEEMKKEIETEKAKYIRKINVTSLMLVR